MIVSNLTKESGVYVIVNLINGKYYVGSSVSIKSRVKVHYSSLSKNKHHNKYLQNDWNEFGSDKFTVKVVSVGDSFLEEEQKFLNNRNNAYNICNVVGEVNPNVKLFEKFIDPNGNEVAITNLSKFCRENDLSFTTMLRVSQGNRTSCQGWTHKNSPNKKKDAIKIYEGFINPSGEEVTIDNLSKFCYDNNLLQSKMWLLYNGKRLQHKGWRHIKTKYLKKSVIKTYTGFVTPNNENIVINNLDNYCKDNNLSPSGMRGLIAGTGKSHKGYTYNG